MTIKTPYTSHRDDTHDGGKAPTKAHMALQTGKIGDPAGLLAIPPGAHLFFIEDPRRADTIIECILEKVVFENHHLKEIRLVAYTRSTKSTRRLHLTAAWSGEYRSALDEDKQAAEAAMRKLEGENKNS